MDKKQASKKSKHIWERSQIKSEIWNNWNENFNRSALGLD